MTIFSDVLAAYPQMSYLGQRPVPGPRAAGPELDPGYVITDGSPPGFLRRMLRHWPDQDTSDAIRSAMSDLDMERASVAPVVHVSYGPQVQVSYGAVSTLPGTGPSSLPAEPASRVITVTRRLADVLSAGRHAR